MDDLDDWTIYDQAADAITAGQFDIYAAIRAAAPALDWTGHDRRMALARGASIAQLGPDPTLLPHSHHRTIDRELALIRPVLGKREIRRCKCGAQVWYPPAQRAPYDVIDGRGSAINHFVTCPNAAEFKKSARRKAA